ncbi:hypothetical protein MBLNU230_g5184t1 [Neophaeotheca triangularis]
METTMATPTTPTTPRSHRQTSQLRDTFTHTYPHNQTHNAIQSPTRPTRSLPQTDSLPLYRPPYQQPPQNNDIPAVDDNSNAQPLSAPASQESFLSLQSNGSSLAQAALQETSSNSSTSQLTQSTQYTDATSPIESAPSKSFASRHLDHGRVRTPEAPPFQPTRSYDNDNNNNNPTLANPVTITSPASINGAKRTASGHVKTASLTSTPMTGPVSGQRRSRGESVSSTTSSRASEMAATLRTRLEYAMAKVQQGWENRSLAEVEQLAAQQASPRRHGMGYGGEYGHGAAGRPVSSGLTNGAARLSMYESYGNRNGEVVASPPNKRHSGPWGMAISPPLQYHRAPNNGEGGGPRLAPPADIRPQSQRQSRTHHHDSSYYSHSNTSTSNHTTTAPTTTSASVMSPPRTPHFPSQHPHRQSQSLTPAPAARPPTIRTETETAAAEREALAALYQLGSPRGSQQGSQFQSSGVSQREGREGAGGGKLATPGLETGSFSKEGLERGVVGRSSP